LFFYILWTSIICITTLSNSQNKILEGILENKIILIIQTLLILYYIVVFNIRSLNIAFYIAPYFLLVILFYVMFYLGDVNNYDSYENSHFITIFISTFPICIVLFNLVLKNTILISKNLTMKIEENLNLRIDEFETSIKNKEKNEQNIKEININNIDNSYSNFENSKDDIYKNFSKEQLISIKENLISYKKVNFKFSFSNIIKFFCRDNIKSLVNFPVTIYSH